MLQDLPQRRAKSLPNLEDIKFDVNLNTNLLEASEVFVACKEVGVEIIMNLSMPVRYEAIGCMLPKFQRDIECG